MLDFPATGNALWSIYDSTGIRPEYALVVIALESRFDPSIVNSIGCVGLNQFCGTTYFNYVNVPVATYRTWLASQQLAGPIKNYWRNALAEGPIRSGARLMLAQLGTTLLSSVASLNDVIFTSPSAPYAANAWLDASHSGAIKLQDLANALEKFASQAMVQNAISQTYALRPGETPQDPVYGTDFSSITFSNLAPLAPLALAASLLFVGAVLAKKIHPQSMPSWIPVPA